MSIEFKMIDNKFEFYFLEMNKGNRNEFNQCS